MKKGIAIFTAAVLTAAMAGVFAGCNAKADDKDVTLELEDGSIYVGQAVDGVPNGHGKVTDYLGSVWEGTFTDGALNGYGTYMGYDLVEYEGNFVAGIFNGFGHHVSPNGDEYWGQFEDGNMNGVGRMNWATDCVYEGGFVDGYMQGMGWMTWPAGDVYFGEWNLGQPAGFGCKAFYKTYSVEGDYQTYDIYVGNMANNQMDGWGIMRFGETGGLYMGDWDMGTRDDDDGIYYFEEGIATGEVKFVGSFSKDKNGGWIWGEGTMYYSDGRVVTGTWEGQNCVEEKSVSTADPTALGQEANSIRASVLENSSYLGLKTVNK